MKTIFFLNLALLLVTTASAPAATRLVPRKYATIQAAIDDCNDGDVVIVAPGTYTGDGNRNIDFNGLAITVRSKNGPEDCIIDCNGTRTEQHRGFYFHNEEDANCVLKGFTIRNGYSEEGGGIYCSNNSEPTIIDCILTTNVAGPGGGMYNEYSSPRVINCAFTNNRTIYYGSGMYNKSSSPLLVNCIFSANNAMGRGGFCAGMYNYDNSNPTLINCIFSGNRAWFSPSGMLNYADSNPTLINCIFSGNLVYSDIYSSGGGMYNFETSPTLINCTFSRNSANSGGGICNKGAASRPTLTNCILWGNSDSGGVDESAQIYNREGANPVVNYNCIQGLTGELGGIGNIATDPCFVELGYWEEPVWIDGDYHLFPGSPCIDAGDPNYIPEPNETDIDGQQRVINGRVDIGADEYSPPVPAEADIVPDTLNLASKGKWITCHIWLPEDYNVADIDPNSVLLEGEIEAESLRFDGQVAIARFNRSDVQDILSIGLVELTISGQLTDETIFEGTDVIRVINKGGGKSAQ